MFPEPMRQDGGEDFSENCFVKAGCLIWTHVVWTHKTPVSTGRFTVTVK